MTFAQRKPLSQPEAGQTLLAGREKEIGLYRLHYHRSPDHPEVRLITALSGPGGVGKTRLLDELEWYRPTQTIYSRIEASAGFGHDATRLMRAIADGLHRAGEAMPTPQFDQLYQRRQMLLEKALTRSSDPKQILRYFYRPVLLGVAQAVGHRGDESSEVSPLEQLAYLRWNEADLNLAFGDPIGLLTQALVADLNRASRDKSENGDAGEEQGEESELKEAPGSKPQAEKVVLMFDTFELMAEVVGEWLLTYLLGQAREAITCDLRLVIAGRVDLLATDERWRQAWAEHILSLPLAPFTPAEVGDFMRKNTVLKQPAAPSFFPASPLPIWLTVWTTSGAAIRADWGPAEQDVSAQAETQNAQPTTPTYPSIHTFFSAAQREWLTRAALAGVFDQPRLVAMMGHEEGRAAFKWLMSQPMLVRPSSVPGQFRLDRTLAEALLEETGVELSASWQKLLDYLDQHLALLRADLLKTKTPTDYQVALLERLHHSFGPGWPAGTAPGTEQFLQASFIEALHENPPFMFDILALVVNHDSVESQGDRGAAPTGGFAQEQRGRGVEKKGWLDSWSEDLNQNLKSKIQNLKSLAEAWLAGQWEQMQTGLSHLAGDERLLPEQKALICNWWGYSYRAAGDPPKALEIYGQGLALAPQEGALYFERGLTYLAQQGYGQAIADFNQAISLASHLKGQRAIIFHSRGLAYAHAAEPDYLQAIEDYHQAIRLDPENSTVFADRGWAFAQQENYKRAIEDYNQALHLNPHDAVAYFYRGLAWAAQQEMAQAIHDFSQAVQLRPTYAEAFHQRGLVYLQQQQPETAIADFNRAIELQPQVAASFRQRALAYIQQDNFAQAIDDLDQAIRLDPVDRISYFNLGLAYMQQNDPLRAIKNFDRVLELQVGGAEAQPISGDPSRRRGAGERKPKGETSFRATAFFQRGLAYMQPPLENYAQAIENFDQALELNATTDLLDATSLANLLKQRGLASIQQKEYARAIDDFNGVIKRNPQSASAYVYRGRARAEQGDYVRAVEDYNEALKLEPQAALTFYERGRAYAGQGNFERALQDYDEAVKRDATQAAFFYEWGLALAAQQKYGEAIAAYEQAIQLNPKEAEVFHNLGLALAHQGNYAEALENYEQAIQLKPDNVEIWQNRGLAQAALLNYEQAIVDFSRALQLDPNHAATHNYRGSVYANSRQYQQAIQDFTQAILFNPREATYYHNRGIILMQQGAITAAIEDFNQAIRLNPEDPAIYNNCGNAHFKQGDYLRAIEDYNHALRLDTTNPATFKNRGLAYNNLGDIRQAIKDYSQAIRLTPDDISIYRYRAAAYEAIGDYEQAFGDYDQALTLDPTSISTLHTRALAHYNLGYYERAIRDFNRALELDPNDVPTFHNRGLIYYHQGNYTQAMRDFDQAIRLDPDDADVIYHKACVLARLRQDEAATTWLTQAIELDPGNRDKALNNSDFEGLWYKPAFRRLFGYQ